MKNFVLFTFVMASFCQSLAASHEVCDRTLSAGSQNLSARNSDATEPQQTVAFKNGEEIICTLFLGGNRTEELRLDAFNAGKSSVFYDAPALRFSANASSDREHIHLTISKRSGSKETQDLGGGTRYEIIEWQKVEPNVGKAELRIESRESISCKYFNGEGAG